MESWHVQLYCGTSGFSYKEWKGPFYPKTLPAGRMLAFYATRLPAVEINNSFYRMPKPSVIDGWRDAVPDGFRFVIKAPRRISHHKRLQDCEQDLAYLAGAISGLGARLGAVLVQLPPYFRLDLARLEAFLEQVPEQLPLAFEFRHDSWQDDAVFDMLREHRAAWVTVDTDGKAPPQTLPRTADWTYLRLRAPDYSPDALLAWCERCRPFDHAFVFFKHEDEGAGPALAQRMLALSDRS